MQNPCSTRGVGAQIGGGGSGGGGQDSKSACIDCTSIITAGDYSKSKSAQRQRQKTEVQHLITCKVGKQSRSGSGSGRRQLAKNPIPIPARISISLNEIALLWLLVSDSSEAFLHILTFPIRRVALADYLTLRSGTV